MTKKSSPVTTSQSDAILQLELAVEHYVHRAEQYFEQRFERPQIRYDLRGLTAGMALPDAWELRFNLPMYLRQPEAFLAQVPGHEVAHLIAHRLFAPANSLRSGLSLRGGLRPRRQKRLQPHGQEWRAIMQQVFELEPITRHQLQAEPARKERTVTYVCQCTQHELGIRRHHNVLRKGAVYRCKHCHTNLRPVEGRC
ncbi:MAG: SprT-like domain-containing protein [Pseudomonadota bacterium]|nr:SprT-like domain-containing protein [Pseudomonadota bacterium]